MDEGPPPPVSRGTSRQEGTEAYRLLHFPRPSCRLPPFLTKFSLDSRTKGKTPPLGRPPRLLFFFQGNNLLGGPVQRNVDEKKKSKTFENRTRKIVTPITRRCRLKKGTDKRRGLFLRVEGFPLLMATRLVRCPVQICPPFNYSYRWKNWIFVNKK